VCVAESHFDNCFVEEAGAFTPRLDQDDVGVDRGGDHQAWEAGAAADIEKASFPIEAAKAQNLGINHKRDWDNTIEDMEDDLNRGP